MNIVLAFSLKFYSALTPKLAEDLKQLDVPIISAVSLYKETVEEWRASPVGISAEVSCLIEPTVLIAKGVRLKVRFFRLSGVLPHLFLLRCPSLPDTENTRIMLGCGLTVPMETEQILG